MEHELCLRSPGTAAVHAMDTVGIIPSSARPSRVPPHAGEAIAGQQKQLGYIGADTCMEPKYVQLRLSRAAGCGARFACCPQAPASLRSKACHCLMVLTLPCRQAAARRRCTPRHASPILPHTSHSGSGLAWMSRAPDAPAHPRKSDSHAAGARACWPGKASKSIGAVKYTCPAC